MKKTSSVVYAYSTKKNKKFIQDFAESRSQSVSYVVNAIIDELRINPKWQESIKMRVPAFVEKANRWQESRLSS